MSKNNSIWPFSSLKNTVFFKLNQYFPRVDLENVMTHLTNSVDDEKVAEKISLDEKRRYITEIEENLYILYFLIIFPYIC